MRLKPCGTVAAHHRHLYYDEEPCESCKEAARAYARNLYQRDKNYRAMQNARVRAKTRLALLHDDEFQVLLAEEVARYPRE